MKTYHSNTTAPLAVSPPLGGRGAAVNPPAKAGVLSAVAVLHSCPQGNGAIQLQRSALAAKAVIWLLSAVKAPFRGFGGSVTRLLHAFFGCFSRFSMFFAAYLVSSRGSSSSSLKNFARYGSYGSFLATFYRQCLAVTTVTTVSGISLKTFSGVVCGFVTPLFFSRLLSHWCYKLSHCCHNHCNIYCYISFLLIIK